MAFTTIRKVVSFGVLAMAIGALFAASWAVLERPYGTIESITLGTTAGIISPIFAAVFCSFVALGVVFVAAVFARKPLRSPNYPRIEHLRIAGKYQAVGRFGEAGISPFHLRR